MTPTNPSTTPIALLQSGVASGIWQLDPIRSRIALSVKHLWGLKTVRGRFEGIAGIVDITESGSVFGVVTVEAASVSTGLRARDARLRSPDFLDAAAYPHIVFDICDMHLMWPDRGLVLGALTVAERHTPLCFEATLGIEPLHHWATVDAAVDVQHAMHGRSCNPLLVPAEVAHLDLHLVFARATA